MSSPSNCRRCGGLAAAGDGRDSPGLVGANIHHNSPHLTSPSCPMRNEPPSGWSAGTGAGPAGEDWAHRHCLRQRTMAAVEDAGGERGGVPRRGAAESEDRLPEQDAGSHAARRRSTAPGRRADRSRRRAHGASDGRRSGSGSRRRGGRRRSATARSGSGTSPRNCSRRPSASSTSRTPSSGLGEVGHLHGIGTRRCSLIRPSLFLPLHSHCHSCYARIAISNVAPPP